MKPGSLEKFTADFAAAKLSLSGKVAHAPELQNWPLFQARASPTPRTNLRFNSKKSPIFFNQIDSCWVRPGLTLAINGDARTFASFNLKLTLDAAGAESPWGAVETGFLRRATHFSPAKRKACPPHWTLGWPWRRRKPPANC